VNVVTGASRFGGVVANFCAVLMAKEQFDCDVAVQYPISAQGIILFSSVETSKRAKNSSMIRV
jgi:hypothetical protein